MTPRILQILDANRNGLPELMILLGFASQGGHGDWVIEWDGNTFQNVLVPVGLTAEYSL